MAQVTATFRLDSAALRGFVGTAVVGAVTQAAGRTRDYAKAEISTAGRIDTGQMRNGIVAETAVVNGDTVSARVKATAAHSAYQHEGTGLYGPRGAPIVARRARVLRFRPKGGSAFVFAREVAGVKPLPFLTLALERLTPADYV